MDLNDQTAGTCRNAGLGKRRNEIPDSGSMTRIDNDRIMRQLLKDGNRTNIKRIARVLVVKRANSRSIKII